jgi:hypothetical protein
MEKDLTVLDIYNENQRLTTGYFTFKRHEPYIIHRYGTRITKPAPSSVVDTDLFWSTHEPYLHRYGI